MLFCKLLLSPMPHCRVRRDRCARGARDARRQGDPDGRRSAGRPRPPLKGRDDAIGSARSRADQRAGLSGRTDSRHRRDRRADRRRSDRPHHTRPRAAALRRRSAREPAPRRPERAARRQRSCRRELADASSGPAEDFGSAPDGALPMGEPGRQWAYGDLDAGFKRADSSSTRHFIRSRRATSRSRPARRWRYWQNGKLYLHCSTQSVVQTVESVGAVGRHRCRSRSWSSASTRGGGFGSKIPGAHTLGDPGAAGEEDRHAGDDAHQPRGGALHRPRRPALLGRASRPASARTAASPRWTSSSLQDNGPYENQYDHRRRRPASCSLAYQPMAMRFRGLSVLTNTPPRTYQRSPGGMQQNAIMEPLAREGGAAARDRSGGDAPHQRAGRQGAVRPARQEGRAQHVDQRLRARGPRSRRRAFDWDGAKRAAGNAAARRSRGIGVAVSPFIGGYSIGYDGLHHDPARRQALRAVRHRQPRHALGDRHGARRRRGARHAVGQVEVVLGNTGRHLPWTCTSDGSQTMHAMSRANHAGAMDAKRKLQEIAARDLGGRPGGLRAQRRARRTAPGSRGMSRSRRPHAARSRSAASSTATSCRQTSTR